MADGHIDRIVADPDTLFGKPRIRGTRLGVAFVMDLLKHGWSRAQILENYQGLTSDDIDACVQYASRDGSDQG